MATQHLREWWTDDPADPDRVALSDSQVQQLAAAICPGAPLTDLGGVMSLNVKLGTAGLVLRVHQPFVSRPRLLALQAVRHRLANLGLIVPAPVAWQGAMLFRCRNRWAELEEYMAHERLAHQFEAYLWLFQAMGLLHRALRQIHVAVPRPLVATYAPPSSLRRWLAVTAAAVQGNPAAVEIAQHLDTLIRQLRQQWQPATRLPMQFVHGDVRLSNVGRTPTGTVVYLDFGFLAWRPRIHDLAYSLAFMFLALNGQQGPENFPWERVPQLLAEYENAAGVRLTDVERQALAPYTAAVPLYAAALDGFTEDPAGKLCSRLAFLHLSEWILSHPSVLRVSARG